LTGRSASGCRRRRRRQIGRMDRTASRGRVPALRRGRDIRIMRIRRDCAFIPAMLLAGAVQDDLSNWNPYPAYAVVCVFIFGFFVMSWYSENGPPRPGRGVLKRGARKQIGIVVLSFFVIALLVMVGVEWIDTGTLS